MSREEWNAEEMRGGNGKRRKVGDNLRVWTGCAGKERRRKKKYINQLSKLKKKMN